VNYSFQSPCGGVVWERVVFQCQQMATLKVSIPLRGSRLGKLTWDWERRLAGESFNPLAGESFGKVHRLALRSSIKLQSFNPLAGESFGKGAKVNSN